MLLTNLLLNFWCFDDFIWFRCFLFLVFCVFIFGEVCSYQIWGLAVFEDSGWYKPDMSAADPVVKGVHWGYKQGCNFATGKCVDNDTPVSKVFCSDANAISCSLDRKSVKSCDTCKTISRSFCSFSSSKCHFLQFCWATAVPAACVQGDWFCLWDFASSLFLYEHQQIGRVAWNGLLPSLCYWPEQSCLVWMFEGQGKMSTCWEVAKGFNGWHFEVFAPTLQASPARIRILAEGGVVGVRGFSRRRLLTKMLENLGMLILCEKFSLRKAGAFWALYMPMLPE